MKYSQRLHVALILISFAVLFAVIGSAYSQSRTRGAVSSKGRGWTFADSMKTDTIPSPVWHILEVDSAAAARLGIFIVDSLDLFVDTIDTYPPTAFAFFDSSDAEVLSLRPNGDIFWRRRLVTTDSMLVQGLRDILEGRR